MSKDAIGVFGAAHELFTRKGISNTTLEEIAKESKTDTKKLKAQYPNMETLVDDMIKRDVEETTELFNKIINDRGNANIKLTRLVRELLTRYQKSYPVFYLISAGMDQECPDSEFLRGRLKSELIERYRQNTAIIGRLIAQGQSENLFSDVDPLEAAYLLRGMISAAIRYRRMIDKVEDMREQAEIVMRVFLKGLLR